MNFANTRGFVDMCYSRTNRWDSHTCSVTQQRINSDFVYTFNVTKHKQFDNKNYVFVKKKNALNQRPRTTDDGDTWVYKIAASSHSPWELIVLCIHVPYTVYNMNIRV